MFQYIRFHLIGWEGSHIYMRAPGSIPGQETLFRHDLHDLQGGGISYLANFIQFLVHLPDGLGTILPNNLHDLKFRFSGFHGLYTKVFVANIENGILKSNYLTKPFV
jgi:hypothetical protein